MKHSLIPQSEESVEVNGVRFSHGDIFRVVDDFYTRVQNDPQLSVPFQSVHDWPKHIEQLTHFWWIRFGGRNYLLKLYNPVAKHFEAGFTRELLARWLALFHETLRMHLREDQIHLWTIFTERMGEGLAQKNEFLVQKHRF